MGKKFDFSNLDWKWVAISIIIFLVVQVALSIAFSIFGLVTLTLGFILFFILKPVAYFIGGYITGRFSPGVTITEPAVGAIIVAVAGLFFDAGRFGAGKLIWGIISAAIAFFLAIYGASLGEKK